MKLFVCFLFLFNVAHSWPPLQSGEMGRENFFYRLRERQSNLTWKCFIARPSQKQLLSSILLGSFILPTSNANIRFFHQVYLITNIVCFSLCTEPFLSMLILSLWTAAGFLLQTAILCCTDGADAACVTLSLTLPQLSSDNSAAAERAACASCGTAAIRPVNTTRLFHGLVSYLLKTVCSKCVFFFTFLTCWCFTFNPTWKPICLIFFVWDVTVNSSCSYCSFNVESILFSNQASMMSLIKMKLTVMLIFPNKIHWPSCYLVKCVLGPYFRTRNNQKHYKLHPYIYVQNYFVGHPNSLLGQLSDGSYCDLILYVSCTFLYKWFILEQTLQQVHANPEHKFSFCCRIYWKTL